MLIRRNIKDKAWRHILNFINYDNKIKNFPISAKQIKEARKTTDLDYQFEPRILCKQDSLKDKPEVFKENNLSILSIKNGEYILTQNNIYVDLNCKDIETINFTNKTNDSVILNEFGEFNSENSLLDEMQYNGTLEYIFGENIKYGSFLGGRHRVYFKTILNEEPIEINGTQIEIDGCYETEKSIFIIEAKNKFYENFNIRQLYYPYKYIYDRLEKKNIEKNIYCIFLHKDNENLYYHKYSWTNPNKMMDIIEIEKKMINLYL